MEQVVIDDSSVESKTLLLLLLDHTLLPPVPGLFGDGVGIALVPVHARGHVAFLRHADQGRPRGHVVLAERGVAWKEKKETICG